MVRFAVVALLAGAWGAGPPPGGPPAQESPVCVIQNVDGASAQASAPIEVIRRVFLMRQALWPSGAAAHPVNLPATSTVRERFSEAVLGQSVKQLVPYWNERYFHGTRPPPTVASEEAVLLFVARTAGAVGYVSADRTDALPENVSRVICLPAGDSAP